jgi:bifunctional DNA-binding transcriptional regulator/antitoxin component of YhaV-PrlF toxin-antitoxin module
MSTVSLGPKGQLTIPDSILQQWGVEPNDQLELSFQNGVATLTPVKRQQISDHNSLMEFAGVGAGCWGEMPDDVNDYLCELRSSWVR